MVSNPQTAGTEVLRFAGAGVSQDDALQALRDYAEQRGGTLRWYDRAGGASLPKPADAVELADIGRLVVINARLDADDVPQLLEPFEPGLWTAVGHEVDFRDLPEDPRAEPAYTAVSELYLALRDRPGIGRTKATKLLHLKRPRLVPVVDSVVLAHYRDTATELARQWELKDPQYWAAIWSDARRNDPLVQALLKQLRQAGGPAAEVADLSPLRVHDILMWSRFRPRRD